MSKLDTKQQEALQLLADTVRITDLIASDASLPAILEAARTAKTACPRQFQHALNLGRMMIETGVLVLDGHGAEIVFGAMNLVVERQEFFDAAFEMTKDCAGCSSD